MKIAVITVTKDDDDRRLSQWKDFYNEYKNDVYLHVIVDNASRQEYVKKLEEAFPDSVIIKRKTNGGCTGAYNDGLQYCLDNSEADAIALLANDIKLSDGALGILYKELFENSDMCMIGPAECKPGTDIIENFGHHLGAELTMVCVYAGKKISELTQNREYTELVNGGENMAKSSFYRDYGLQDDKLFMYSDEIDTMLRAERANLKIGVTADAISWHYHIAATNSGERKAYCCYLMSRNKIYIAKKYFDKKRENTVYRIFLRNGIRKLIYGILKCQKNCIEEAVYSLKGLKNGRKGDMTPNKYSAPQDR